MPLDTTIAAVERQTGGGLAAGMLALGLAFPLTGLTMLATLLAETGWRRLSRLQRQGNA